MPLTYEEMSMPQLKSLCQDRGLGTARSKQELIDKLTAYDNRDQNDISHEADDLVLTEDQIDAMMEKGEPVELTSKDEDPSPTVFRISFTHSGPLLDSDHIRFRMETYALARAEGLNPFGNPYTARLVKSEGGQLTYEIEVQG